MFGETMECFRINDFTDEEITSILKMIAGILLLGNVKFVQKGKKCDIEDIYLIKKICELFQCDEDTLIKALTLKINVIKQRQEYYLMY